MRLLGILLLAFASSSYGGSCGSMEEQINDMTIGSKISDSDAFELKSRSKENPNNASTHIKLAGYFLYGQSLSGKFATEYANEVLWLIKECPGAYIVGNYSTYVNKYEMPEVYLQVKQSWLIQLEKQAANIRVIENASRFFMLSDKELALKYSKQGLGIDPNNNRLISQVRQLQ